MSFTRKCVVRYELKVFVSIHLRILSLFSLSFSPGSVLSSIFAFLQQTQNICPELVSESEPFSIHCWDHTWSG